MPHLRRAWYPLSPYFWTGGRVIYLHAACEALWRLERQQITPTNE